MPLQSASNNENLQKCVITCRKHLSIASNISCERNDILKWFQGLCLYLTEIINTVGKLLKSEKDQESGTSRLPQDTILLYLTQSLNSLSLFINIFVCEEQKKVVLFEARKCVVKQILCCLDSLEVALESDTSMTNTTGNFVKWMDTALDRIVQINVKDSQSKALEVYEETRQIFEEVLSHGMSIAQISLPEDSKIIRGSCESVLATLRSLENEINKSAVNCAMVNLFIDACSDKLCRMEKKVNTAVLKLCVKIFSEYTSPLEKIHHFCLDKKNSGEVEELDGLVADFDLHVDRIMQIGLFAVSCSTDLTRCIKIRSCLASLEALESELIPSLNAALLDNSVHNINCALILFNYWVEQAFILRQLIFLIIDPFAFCQVIYEEASEIVDNLANCVRKKLKIKQTGVQPLIRLAEVLKVFLETAQKEFGENEIKKLESKVKDYNEILEEIQKATKLLLHDDNCDIENCKRVVKRCKIFLTVLKRLWYCFADDILPNKDIHSEKETDELPSKLENLQMEPTGNPFLDHIINRGKQIIQDRSVLYRTPIKNKSCTKFLGELNATKKGKKELPLCQLVHIGNLSFTNMPIKNETSLDLQITNILKEVTNLSTQLIPQQTSSIIKARTKPFKEQINI